MVGDARSGSRRQREWIPLAGLNEPRDPTHGSTGSSVGGGAALLTAGSVVFLGSAYVVAVALARLLGPAEYGRVSIAVAAMTILNTIHATGLPQALSRYVAANGEADAGGPPGRARETVRTGTADGALRTAFDLQVRATVLTAIGLVAVAAVLAWAGNEVAPLLAVAALAVVPHGVLSLHMAYDNGLRAFRRQAAVLILYSVAKVGLILALAVAARGLGAVAGYAAASLATIAVAGRQRRIAARARGCAPAGTDAAGSPALAAPRVPASVLLAYAAPVVAFVGLSATQLSVDLFLLQAMGGSSAEVGWYAAAQQVARAAYFGLAGLGMVLLPVVAQRDAAGDRQALGHTVRQATRYALLVLGPAAAILAAAPLPAIELLYSSDYSPAAAPLPVLVAGMTALTVFSVLAPVLTGLGRPWVPVGIAAAALTATAVSSVVLIPRLGLVGAALGTTIGAVVALASILVVLGRMLGPVVAPLVIVRIGGAAAMAGAAIAAARPAGFGLLVAALAATALYGLVLVALRELDAADWDRLRSLGEAVRRRARTSV